MTGGHWLRSSRRAILEGSSGATGPRLAGGLCRRRRAAIRSQRPFEGPNHEAHRVALPRRGVARQHRVAGRRHGRVSNAARPTGNCGRSAGAADHNHRGTIPPGRAQRFIARPCNSPRRQAPGTPPVLTPTIRNWPERSPAEYWAPMPSRSQAPKSSSLQTTRSSKRSGPSGP